MIGQSRDAMSPVQYREAEVQTHYLSIVVCVKSYLQFLNMGEGREGNLSMGFEVIGDVSISHSFF